MAVVTGDTHLQSLLPTVESFTSLLMETITVTNLTPIGHPVALLSPVTAM